MKKAYFEKEKAFKIRAGLEDFDGDVDKWKWAFYELWREQMTWDFAYSINVYERSDKSVDVEIICRPAYKLPLLNTMKALGYRNVDVTECYAAVFSPYDGDLENDLDIDAAVIEF